MSRYPFKPEFSGGLNCHTGETRWWYIQDKYLGGDRYEYALMSNSLEWKNRPGEKHMKFDTYMDLCTFLKAYGRWKGDEKPQNEAAAHTLLTYTGVDARAGGCLRTHEVDGTVYVFNTDNRECWPIPPEGDPLRHTGWFSSYAECLQMAQEIIEKHEAENVPVFDQGQLSLF